MEYTFKGYRRPDGTVGTRNHVLLLPADAYSNVLAYRVEQWVRGVRRLVSMGESNRPYYDRLEMRRVLINLACNPNAAAVLLVGTYPNAGNKETLAEDLAQEIRKSDKPVELVTVVGAGGFHPATEQAIETARRLVLEASALEREVVPLSELVVGVKCGNSDPCSGIAGNPTVGNLYDRVVAAGGTCIFDETTEVIGAEHMLAKRFVHPEDGERFLALVQAQEELARATGEDIRNINPVPANIRAGISSLEEKSLGAAAKTGTQPIQGIVEYGERPRGNGLWYMDGWPNGPSLQLGLASAGATVSLYQLGGGGLPDADPVLSPWTAGSVTPLMWTTGNPRTYEKAIRNVDFSAGTVMDGTESVEEAGERLLRHVLRVASGELTKEETVRYDDVPEIPFRGPLF
ncbi:MAG: UxaA family hydrolase [Bacteroidetes bacterium]|nr:UxaA family hydrolase [Bacteroidota bacterium]MCL5025603.1 UxaA family hydrolase [Chloroflexota bacterium]